MEIILLCMIMTRTGYCLSYCFIDAWIVPVDVVLTVGLEQKKLRKYVQNKLKANGFGFLELDWKI